MSKQTIRLVATATLFALSAALSAAVSRPPKLSFEPNVGQTADSIDFLARGGRYAVALQNGSYSLALRSSPRTPRWMLPPWKRFAAPTEVPWVVSMHLADANTEAQAEGRELLAARSHYLRGRDKRRWLRDVPHYGRVRYGEVYPGIDIEYYGTAGAFEFDFIVTPAANPDQIRLKFDGAQEIEVDTEGDLVLRSGKRELRHRRPVIYQQIDGEKVNVAGSYVLEDDETVTFRLASYDTSRPLVIDPLVEWQVTIGGSGDDQFNSVAIGPDGTIHVAGTTESSDIPTEGGWATQPPGGPSDAYVATLRPDGTLINATFLGGSGQDIADDIVVDPDGVTYVIGTTNSTNFPTTEGAFQPMFGGGPADAFVTMFSPDGSDLVGSTFLGGPGLELGTGIALDNQGPGFFVTGSTFAPGFPVTEGAFQTDFMGGADAFVSKLDRLGTNLPASTLFGRDGFDIPADIVIDADGNPYIVGETDSSNLPLPDDAFQPQPGGGIDVFGAGFTGDLGDLDDGTYLGGTGDDRPFGVDDFDLVGVGGVTMFGSTTGGFPTTVNATSRNYLGGATDGFLVILTTLLPGMSSDPYANEPLVTYTGDENQNAVLDVQVVNDHGRVIVVTSDSNFSEDPSPVEGCGDEPRTGSTGEINVFDPTTGTFIDTPVNTPDENCFPGGDILGLADDSFFPDSGHLAGSGLMTTGTNLDGTVIQIDLDGLFATDVGAALELDKRTLSNDKKSIPESPQTCVIDVRNTGPDSAINVVVTDALPPGFTVENIESSGGQCTQADGQIKCNLGAMPPNTAKTIQIRGRAPGETGDYISIATATADNLNGPTRIAGLDLKSAPGWFLGFGNDGGPIRFRPGRIPNRSTKPERD